MQICFVLPPNNSAWKGVKNVVCDWWPYSCGPPRTAESWWISQWWMLVVLHVSGPFSTYHGSGLHICMSWIWSWWWIAIQGLSSLLALQCMHPANERWRYIVTSSLIGWAHTEWSLALCVQKLMVKHPHICRIHSEDLSWYHSCQDKLTTDWM